MSDVNAAAILFSKAVETMAEIHGMTAENKVRESLGHSMAYHEDSFIEAADKLQKARLRLFPLSNREEVPG
jgi:hypothetical protein